MKLQTTDRAMWPLRLLVLRSRFDDANQALERSREQGHALSSRVMVAEARVEHQKAELAAVHRELDQALGAAQQALDLVGALRLDARDVVMKLADSLVGLRRDGFNPAVFGGPWSPPAEPAEPATKISPEDVAMWLRCVEAAQDRAGGDAQLQTRIMADAHRWRAEGIPLKEIEQKIYDGF